MIVTAKDYFSEEKRDTHNTIEMVEDGVPAFRLVNTAVDGRYRISKTVFSDPVREVVLQQIQFEALVGAASDYEVHVIVAPHLVNAGAENTGWCGDFKGHQMLFAEGEGHVARGGFLGAVARRSAGYVGVSDGWQTLSRGEGVCGRSSSGPSMAMSRRRDTRCCLHGGAGRSRDRLWSAAGGSGTARPAQPAAAGLEAALEHYCVGWRRGRRELVPLDQPRDAGGLIAIA